MSQPSPVGSLAKGDGVLLTLAGTPDVTPISNDSETRYRPILQVHSPPEPRITSTMQHISQVQIAKPKTLRFLRKTTTAKKKGRRKGRRRRKGTRGSEGEREAATILIRSQKMKKLGYCHKKEKRNRIPSSESSSEENKTKGAKAKKSRKTKSSSSSEIEEIKPVESKEADKTEEGEIKEQKEPSPGLLKWRRQFAQKYIKEMKNKSQLRLMIFLES